MKILLFFLVVFLIVVLYATIQNMITPQLGVKEGRLVSCPNTPRCVSSQSSRANQKVNPLPYHPAGIEVLAEIIETMPHANIVTIDEVYLYAIFSSPIFGFKDDVEFFRNDETKQIDIRSAARTGYYDLDVNRQRVEKIRSEFLKKLRF